MANSGASGGGAGGVVDTELAAAAALADATANPTVPLVGAALEGYNGTTWDRLRSTTANGLVVDVSRVQGTVTVDSEMPAAAALADATANPTTSTVGAGALMYNGTTWDRVRGDTTNGLFAQIKAHTPGTGTTNLGKAAGGSAGATDVGVALLAARQDTPTALTPTAGQYAQPQVSNLGQVWVVQSRPKPIQVTSSGLTTATTAYSAGDQVGTQFTFAGAAIATGGGGYIESIVLNDETAIIGTYTAWIFRSSATAASDNAAFSISDADSENLVGVVQLGPVYSGVNNFTATWLGSLPYDCAATSLFVLLQTNAGHTFFGAATALKLKLTCAVLG